MSMDLLHSALTVAEDLIAMSEEAYDVESMGHWAVGGDVDNIEDATCDEEGVCHWATCQGAGCVIDKHKRGKELLALVTAMLAKETPA